MRYRVQHLQQRNTCANGHNQLNHYSSLNKHRPLNKPQDLHRQIGMTLLELLIVMSLIAMISLLAIPHFQEYRARHEYTQLFHLLRSHIYLARSHALITQHTVVLCSSSDLKQCGQNQWQHGILLYVDRNNNRQRDDDETIISTAATQLKYAQLTWHGNASHPHNVVFQSDSGLPRGSMGHFLYCHSTDPALQHALPLGAMGHLHSISTNQCR